MQTAEFQVIFKAVNKADESITPEAICIIKGEFFDRVENKHDLVLQESSKVLTKFLEIIADAHP